MPRSKKATLTADEERFVDEYLIDRNALRAYLRTYPGVKKNTAATEGCLLLKKPKIAAAVKVGRDAISRRCRIDQDKVAREYARIAFYDIGDVFDLSKHEPVLLAPRDIPYDTRKAMKTCKLKRRRLRSEVGEDYDIEEWDYQFLDKLTALDKLARHLGFFKDLPPLETFLALLPPDLRETVRESLAAAVFGAAGGGSPGGN